MTPLASTHKPAWLKSKIAASDSYRKVKQIVEQNDLHTICSSGKCPNLGECWERGTG